MQMQHTAPGPAITEIDGWAGSHLLPTFNASAFLSLTASLQQKITISLFIPKHSSHKFIPSENNRCFINRFIKRIIQKSRARRSYVISCKPTCLWRPIGLSEDTTSSINILSPLMNHVNKARILMSEFQEYQFIIAAGIINAVKKGIMRRGQWKLPCLANLCNTYPSTDRHNVQ